MAEQRGIRAVVGALGACPLCIGHYEPGDSECDGKKPCTYRALCRVYKARCFDLGIDPEREKEIVPMRAIVFMAAAMLEETPLPSDEPIPEIIRSGWARFLEAFMEQVPNLPVVYGRDLAIRNQLYWHHGAKNSKGLPVTYTIRSKTGRTPSSDRLVVRYEPRKTFRLEPTIIIPYPLKELLETWPALKDAAWRWEEDTAGRGRLRYRLSKAVAVLATNIDNLARLAASLLSKNELPHLRVREGEVQAHNKGQR